MNADAELPTQLQIALTAGGVVLSGVIDAHTAPRLDERLTPLPGAGTDVSIDVAGVVFIDSSGLGVLIAAHRRAVEAGRRVVLVRPGPAVVRLIEISGLSDHLTLSGEHTEITQSGITESGITESGITESGVDRFGLQGPPHG